ncbi:DUF6243 family protein [Streptomyces gamaensis]|uniref:DUF6243 family protein n=1 Tax=Streptomyces gamaensis TaxID=1763542 RepID=A0ABW0Z7A2_9ACTN
MPRGNAGSMLGVGGTRSNLSRTALRGGARAGQGGARLDAAAQKRELLRALREGRSGSR